jgi:hypothetical protein
MVNTLTGGRPVAARTLVTRWRRARPRPLRAAGGAESRHVPTPARPGVPRPAIGSARRTHIPSRMLNESTPPGEGP